MNAFDLSILSFLNRFAHRSLSFFDQAVVFLMTPTCSREA